MAPSLLIASDPDRWLAALPDAADVATAGSADDAGAYLGGTAFEAVYVAPGVDADAVRARVAALGLATPVEAVADPSALAARLAGGGGDAALAHVRDELSRVAHALNNPLAVIVGNAQLAAEVARSVPTDPMVVEALDSITTAASELESLFSDVAALRAHVDRAARR